MKSPVKFETLDDCVRYLLECRDGILAVSRKVESVENGFREYSGEAGDLLEIIYKEMDVLTLKAWDASYHVFSLAEELGLTEIEQMGYEDCFVEND